jgi:hypothetical protein
VQTTNTKRGFSTKAILPENVFRPKIKIYFTIKTYKNYEMSYGTLTYRHFLLTAGRPSESSFPASNSIGEDERAPEDD